MVAAAIGYRIRQQRKHLGFTQQGLAKDLGISAAYLNLIEANKRRVGGDLLKRLAQLLGLNVESLSGAAEQRLTDDLSELPSDPLFSTFFPEPNFAEKMVTQNPENARMLLILYRAYLEQGRSLSIMHDRLNRDPQLQTSIHKMLTHITSIRSVSEILHDSREIGDSQRQRFHEVLESESTRLTEDARRMVSYFEMQESTNPTAALAEQVDEFIISNRNYFPALERVSEELSDEITKVNRRDTEGALVDYLFQRLAITVHQNQNETAAVGAGAGASKVLNTDIRNQCWFNDEDKTLNFLPNCSRATRRFQMIRLAAELIYDEVLDATVDHVSLSSHAARQQTKHVLSSYIAAAVLMPYDVFLQDAREYRYDIEVLVQKYDVGFEQVCHRLVSLRKLGDEGIPLAFARVDPSGYISKRFPLSQLSLPRYGHICPIWTVFSAFQVPGRISRDLVEFPDGRRFVMVARTITKHPSTFHAHSVLYSVMLAFDVIDADQTIYSDGISFNVGSTPTKVGSSCNQCSRKSCPQRQN